MRLGRKVSWWVITGILLFSVAFAAWASTAGDYSGQTETWGITEISGDFAVFCNRDDISLDVRRLDLLSVTWNDLANETDGLVVRTSGNGAVVTDFTLPGT